LTENHTKHVNTQCGNDTARGTYSQQTFTSLSINMNVCVSRKANPLLDEVET